MNVKSICSIDPGVYGAAFHVSLDGKVLDWWSIPLIEKEVKNYRRNSKKKTRTERYYNLKELTHNLRCINPENTLIYLEKAHARQNEGGTMGFKFGRCYGEIRGILMVLDLKTKIVTPGEWCRFIHKGLKGDSAKERSKKFFVKHYREEFKYTKKLHEGVIDAGCIAEYGRNRVLNGYEDWK